MDQNPESTCSQNTRGLGRWSEIMNGFNMLAPIHTPKMNDKPIETYAYEKYATNISYHNTLIRMQLYH